jgi:catechol 2,3-dioxygenase-like lactoylglutathione lyase family enzyme
MFSHIMVGTNDIAASKKFYDATLGALGIAPGNQDDKGRVFYMTKTGMRLNRPSKVMRGTPQASPMAARLAKTLPAFAKARWAKCTSPIYVIQRATSFAL